MTTTEVTNLVARAMARAEALTNVPATDDYNANTDRADLPSVAVANSLVEATEDVNEAEGLWYSNSTNSTLSIVHEIEVENSNNNSNSLLLESITSVRTMNTNNTVDAVMPEAAIATANPVTEARELVKV